MSSYINEIVNDIKVNPTQWKHYKGRGLQKDNIIISGFGNSKLLSICMVEINGTQMPTTYIDCWKLEAIVGEWYRTVNLKTISI